MAAKADGRPGAVVNLDYQSPEVEAIIGVVNKYDLEWVGGVLSEKLIRPDSRIPLLIGRLTAEGWRHVEALKHAQVVSRYSFFARQFDNRELDELFERCLQPAVKQTGFELRRASQMAGLIDAIIESEIRRCRFVIADLSDDNAGAYWEAGFAEGLGKPVIYLCRTKDKIDPTKEKKTHFDTDHRHKVRWGPDSESFPQTAENLKAAIRNTLLGDARQED